ncbi:hypothetical protein B0H13DRAFT_1898586 [Mycena leptocephala]|nr:hypothetical protein B0H13DRAFT_1898586 [Mycena leptocephala]
MKFSVVFIAFTAVATVSAARVDTNAYRMARGLPPNPPPNGPLQPLCTPALLSCSVNSECCGDICLLGVSVPLSEFMTVSVLRCSDYSFAFNWRAEIVRVCVLYREVMKGVCVAEAVCPEWEPKWSLLSHEGPRDPRTTSAISEAGFAGFCPEKSARIYIDVHRKSRWSKDENTCFNQSGIPGDMIHHIVLEENNAVMRRQNTTSKGARRRHRLFAPFITCRASVIQRT